MPKPHRLAARQAQVAGAGVGEVAGGDDGLAGDEGLDVAAAALDEAAGAGGEVVDELGRLEGEGVVVEDVDVRESAGSEDAAEDEI